MIHVHCDSYRTFQHFLQEFHLREHMGNGSNREGQAVWLRDEDSIRGISRGIVLVWGPRVSGRVDAYIRTYCGNHDIPVLEVPDLRRQHHFRDHPSALRF